MRRARPVLLALAGLLAGATAAPADVVLLRNGSRVEGVVLEEDDAGVLVECATAAGRSRLRIPRDRIASVERTASPTETPAPARPARDEWFLLRSDQRTVGTRHLLQVRQDHATGQGWRLQEELLFLPQGRVPAVRIQRIEDVSEDFLPLDFAYREQGEAGDVFEGEAYEISRTGPVRAGVWSVTESATRGEQRRREVALPAQARGPLALREFLARVQPRPVGLLEMPMVDTARGEVRTVRAGFVGLDVGGAGAPRQDLLRLEEGDRALESRWGIGDPPVCLGETVAPGILAVPCSREQAEAVRGESSDRRVTVPEAGFEVLLPGASWSPDVAPRRPGVGGLRVVAKVASRLLASDVRIEWDPAGAGPDPETTESALLERLRAQGRARDVVVEAARAPVAGLEGAWRMTVLGTVRGERLRTIVLVADRGPGRVVLLAACPVGAWAEAREPLEALLASFRWL